MIAADIPYVQCYAQAAETFKLPFSLLPGIAMVERGRLGESTPNKNGTSDHGIMQINDYWTNLFKSNFGITATQIRDNACLGIWMAGYIVRYEINRAGDFWKGVGRYHSPDSARQAVYIRKVYWSAREVEAAYALPQYLAKGAW